MNVSASLFQLWSPNQFDHTHQHKIRTTYNFAPTFCLFVPNYAAQYLKKSYSKDTFNLQDLDLHNAIEHDGSLVRAFISTLAQTACRRNLTSSLFFIYRRRLLPLSRPIQDCGSPCRKVARIRVSQRCRRQIHSDPKGPLQSSRPTSRRCRGDQPTIHD
jgi:hypothetical protein